MGAGACRAYFLNSGMKRGVSFAFELCYADDCRMRHRRTVGVLRGSETRMRAFRVVHYLNAMAGL
jgi:hypothetical protein